ncbi:MAG: CehA/McbA family metallohydrolase [Thermacetogeniaceae bacterium]
MRAFWLRVAYIDCRFGEYEEGRLLILSRWFKRYGVFSIILLLLLLSIPCLVAASSENPADVPVTITVGPTPIVNGSCLSSDDITMKNGYLAITIANSTVPPWGVPNGSILDGAPVVNGQIGQDHLTLVDFLPNAWAAWPNTYHKVTIAENTPERGSVVVERDYKGVKLVTTYTLEKGSNEVHLVTVMKNEGSETYELYSGYSLCTAGGYMFGPYGATKVEGEEYMQAPEKYGRYVLGYDESWTIALHYPDGEWHDGGTGWKDLYHRHTLKPGDTFTAEAWLQFSSDGNIAPVLERAAALLGEDSELGVLTGKVSTSDGSVVDRPVVIAERDGKPFTWCLGENGEYSLKLPPGKYTVYAVAKNCAPSTKASIEIASGESRSVDFNDVARGGELDVKVTDDKGNPISARITVTGGEEPVVRFLGASTFFTGLGSEKGVSRFTLAPGDYRLVVDSGGSFTSEVKEVSVSVRPGEMVAVSVAIPVLADPKAKGWYGIDQHHHSNVLDGITDPVSLVESQMAAGLDVTLVSDHDSVVNHRSVKELSDAEGVTFLPAVEVSPNWGHFVMLNMPLGELGIDPAGTPTEIFRQAREKGATIVVAHPYITYGYFYNAEKGDIPGTFDSNFDLIELQSTKVTKKGNSPDEMTLKKEMELWTQAVAGQSPKYYLSAGTDTHDVWSYISGAIRVYVHPDGPLSPEAIVDAEKNGHAYVTMGPLVYPQGKMFGETYSPDADGKISFDFDLAAVNGLKRAELWSEGRLVASIDFDGKAISGKALFETAPQHDTWYSLIVEDSKGNRAVTNPIWVKTGVPLVLVDVSVKGNAVNFGDVAPYLENDRVFVPLRAVAESYGYKVDYDPVDKAVRIAGEKSIVLYIGKDTGAVDGKEVKLWSVPFIRDGRTIVPVRLLCELMGADLRYERGDGGIKIDIK